MGSIIMILAVLALGVALGLARGGRIDALRAVRPRWWMLIVGGFVLQAFAENVDVPGAISLSVIGMFVLVIGLVVNASVRGALIAAFGVTMNLFVMVINGAVPIRFEALGEAGLVAADTQRAQITSVGHLLDLETADTRLGFLGDVIPVGLLDSVISIGDLVTFAGMIVIISGLMASRRAVGVEVTDLFGQTQLEDSTQPGDPTQLDLVAPVEIDASSDAVVDVREISDVDVRDLAAMFAEPAAIDLTADPNDIWADDDGAVQVLGPSAAANE